MTTRDQPSHQDIMVPPSKVPVTADIMVPPSKVPVTATVRMTPTSDVSVALELWL